MAVVTLFYRATLLGFSERTALVSKRLYRDQENGKFSNENISLANDLRADFLHFSNYWHFDELANKDEELEHFRLQCSQYRTDSMKQEIADEIDKLNVSLHNFHQFRNTQAVNRLAMLSLIFGAGAVLTGFFGMNFGRAFGKLFFEPTHPTPWVHYVSITLVTLIAFGAIAFGFYVVLSNWSDYRDTLISKFGRSQRQVGSLRRDEGPK
jgi:Mg2+ and Co2+ transporter CorA